MADRTFHPACIARRIAARRDFARQQELASQQELTSRQKLASRQDPGEPALTPPPTPFATAFADCPAHLAAPTVNLADWRRECFTLPPREARETASAWLARYPQARWQSDIENWRIVSDDLVQFTMRRLPEAEGVG